MTDIMDTCSELLNGPFDFQDQESFSLASLDADGESSIIDPRLSIPFYDLDEKSSQLNSADSLLNQPSIWDDEVMPYFSIDSPDFEDAKSVKEEPKEIIQELTKVAVIPTPTPAKPVESNPITEQPPPLSQSASASSSYSAAASAASKSPPPPSAPAQAPTKKRKRQPSQKGKKVKEEISSGGEGEGEEVDFKRSKFLERNRIAASKCRQKKKEWVHELEATKKQLENDHHNLHLEANKLFDEISQLKLELMKHAVCGDEKINKWLEMEASRFVHNATSESRKASSASAGSIASHQSQADSTSGPDHASPITPITQPAASPVLKQEEINYDHMPDELFQ